MSEKVDSTVGAVNETAGRLDKTAAPLAEPVEKTAGSAAEPVGEVAGSAARQTGPVLENADPAIGATERAAEPVLDTTNETLEPATRAVGEKTGQVLDPERTIEPLVDPVQGAVDPVLGRVDNTTAPVLDEVGETSRSLVGAATEVAEPVFGTVNEAPDPIATLAVETLGATFGLVERSVEPIPGSIRQPAEPFDGATMPRIPAHVVEPGGGMPIPGTSEPVSVPVSGTIPAAGASPPPAQGTLGARAGAYGPAEIGGLSPPELGPATAINTPTWERPGALAAPTKAVSFAWSLRGPPVVAAVLGTLIAGGEARVATSPWLLSGDLDVASAANPPNGGQALLPAGPAAPSSGGWSGTNAGGGSGFGGVGLGYLALLLVLLPLVGKLLVCLRDFLEPNSVLVLAIERPG